MRRLCQHIASLIFALTAISFVSTAQVDSTTYKNIVEVIKESQTKFAPDKRTRIVELGFADIPSHRYLIQSTENEAITYLKQQLQHHSVEISYKLFPDSSVDDKPFGVVNLSVANLRTEPSHAAEMATQLLLGTAVDILQARSGDYRVRTPEGYIAWVPKHSIRAMDGKEFDKWKAAKKIIYTGEFGKSYSEADATSLRVSDLVFGNILHMEAVEDQFYKVRYPDGRVAYIPLRKGQPFDEWKASRQLTTENILQSAKTMLGLPYLWGGTSVKGVDCSGFTKTVFYMNGYIIPRDASQQVLAGEQVDILDGNGNFDGLKALRTLSPGDLIFFAAGKNHRPNARVTHVAIYLGDGEFIHAAGSVRINSFLKDRSNYDDFQTRTVVGAKRYTDSEDQQIEKISHSKYY